MKSIVTASATTRVRKINHRTPPAPLPPPALTTSRRARPVRRCDGRGRRSADERQRARGADTAGCLRRPQNGVRPGDGAMRRPPSLIPSATDRTPPEPRATPSIGGHVQRTATWSIHGDGRGRGHGADRATRQPAEHRLRDKETTAKRKKVLHCTLVIIFVPYGCNACLLPRINVRVRIKRNIIYHLSNVR